VAEGKEPFKPPVVNVPNPKGAPTPDYGPPVPALPKLPPPDPSSPPGGGRSSGTGATGAGKVTLLDAIGRERDLNSMRPGSLVLIEFMTTTCVPCKQAIPILKDLQSRYGASGLELAAVVCDDLPQQNRLTAASKYGREHNLNYALYVEPGDAGSVRDRFNVESYPHAVLLNSVGRVLWKGDPRKRDEHLQLESALRQNLGK